MAVPLIAGFGLASELALEEHATRNQTNLLFRKRLLEELTAFKAEVNGAPDQTLPHVLNVSLPGLDSEAVMLALKDVMAISNGSACTSSSYDASHVLLAMGLPPETVRGALRFSWCHMTPSPDWKAFARAIHGLRS